MLDGLLLRKARLQELGDSPPEISPLRQIVLAARLEFAFGSQPMALTVAILLGGMLVGILRDASNTPRLAIWFTALCGLNLVRLAQYRRYRVACSREPLDLARWDRTLIGGCLAAGALWGSSALFFLPAQPALQFFLAFVIAGVAAGAVSGLSVAPAAAHAFLVPCVLPLTLRFVAITDALHVVMGVMTALYTLILAMVARRGDAQLQRLVRSQMEAQASRKALHSSEADKRVSDERLRVATEAGEIGVWEWEPGRERLVWDARMYSLYRIEPAECANPYEAWRQRVHPEDLARVESQMKASALRGGDLKCEFRIRWPNGAERSIRSCATWVNASSDDSARLTGINLDVTDFKRLDNLKREFVSVVSHELRTPMTSIRGSLGLVINEAAGPVSPPAKELLRVADRNVTRLSGLIENLLDIEKLEAGKLHLDLVCLPLGPLIETALSANTPFALGHKVSFTVAGDALAACVVVDGQRLLQVMTHLLSNAVKFSPPGVSVDVVARTQLRGVRIEVHDRGPGIPCELQPRLFSPFAQGDSSDSRPQGGTGLGLAISKALIERMGGTLGFETTAGAGTTFFVELPHPPATAARSAH